MPGPQSAHSPEEWQRARDLAAAGMGFREISERLSISYDNLKQKSSREDWFVPVTAIAEAKAILAQAQHVKSDKPDKNSGELSPSVTTGTEIALSLAEMGQKGALAVVRGLLPKIEETFNPSSPLMQGPIESWKNAGTAFGIFAKASGLDKPQQAVQVNVWGGDSTVSNAIPVESEDDEEP